MNYTKANCSSCGCELQIRIAKGDNSPERVMCKACSQKTGQPTKIKLADALKLAKGSKRVMRCGHRDNNWHVTGKENPTPREKAQIKRIYGSD